MQVVGSTVQLESEAVESLCVETQNIKYVLGLGTNHYHEQTENKSMITMMVEKKEYQYPKCTCGTLVKSVRSPSSSYKSKFTRNHSYKHLGLQIDRECFNRVLSKL